MINRLLLRVIERCFDFIDGLKQENEELKDELEKVDNYNSELEKENMLLRKAQGGLLNE